MSVRSAAVPYGKTPEGEGKTWDGPAAVGRIRQWAGVDGEDPSAAAWAKYREGFTWYDEQNDQTFGAYKLPHHDVESGSLVLSRAGLGAAAQRLDSADIPAGDLAGVKSHLERHYHDLGLKAPWENEENRAVHPVWNLGVKRGADGSKHLDVQLHGVIDGGWFDEEGVDSASLISELQQHLDAKTVGVRINSVGGSAFAGVAIYNALESHPGQVTCYVEGLAASAASLVAMAGKCVMGRGSMMMIHSPSAMAVGNAEELRKTADVLDKIQEALAGIYTKKTGKGLDEINRLVNEETWMTADEAVANGFADSVGVEKEEAGAEDPKMVGDSIAWRGVTFPAARLPQQIVAMARTAPPVGGPIVNNPSPPTVVPPVLAVVPPPDPQPPVTRAELELRSPDVVAALIAEGREAGVAAERARLQAIDELGVQGCADLVTEAKYGDHPTDAATLAMAVVKAGKLAGAELLNQRRVESRALAAVPVPAPERTQESEEAKAAKNIAEHMNRRRGGSQ